MNYFIVNQKERLIWADWRYPDLSKNTDEWAQQINKENIEMYNSRPHYPYSTELNWIDGQRVEFNKDFIWDGFGTAIPLPSKDKEVLKIDSFCILDNISMIVVDGKEWLHYDETKYYIDKLISLLKDYEQWEADILTEDKLWWPNSAKDVLSGKIYDTMIELQHKRNQILYPEKYTSYITTPSKDKEEKTEWMFTLDDVRVALIDGHYWGGKGLELDIEQYFKVKFSIDISNK